MFEDGWNNLGCHTAGYCMAAGRVVDNLLRVQRVAMAATANWGWLAEGNWLVGMKDELDLKSWLNRYLQRGRVGRYLLPLALPMS